MVHLIQIPRLARSTDYNDSILEMGNGLGEMETEKELK